MPNNMPSELRKELNRLAFKGSHKNMKDLFLKEDSETILSLIEENSSLLDALRNLALNENAGYFETILSKLGHDSKALEAILNGFKADEQFNSSHSCDEVYGTSANPADLEKKRSALREFALDQNAQEKNIQRRPHFPER